MWNGICKTIGNLRPWLKWRIGNGNDLFVGVDPFIRDEGGYWFDDAFIKELHDRRMVILSQFYKGSNFVPYDRWLSASDLNLPLRWHETWESYILKLVYAGIDLQNSADRLLWDGPGSKGVMSVMRVYNMLASLSSNPPPLFWWHNRIWSWKIPLKHKCFLWLCFQNKILTWDNIQKCGFFRPGMCILCREAEEDLHHIFFQCWYICAVWQVIRGWLNEPDLWTGNDLMESLRSWFERFANLSSMPLFLISGTCHARNLGIFEDELPSLESTAMKVLYHWKGQPIQQNIVKVRRVSYPVHEEGRIYDYFDGASQYGLCGAGIMIHISRSHCIKITVGLGCGNGLKAELLALRSLMWFARRMGYKSIIIFGDSQVIVNWFIGKHVINEILLEHWMEEIRNISKYFNEISCQHIYREANWEANKLSKLEMGPIDGLLRYTELIEGNEIDQG